MAHSSGPRLPISGCGSFTGGVVGGYGGMVPEERQNVKS